MAGRMGAYGEWRMAVEDELMADSKWLMAREERDASFVKRL